MKGHSLQITIGMPKGRNHSISFGIMAEACIEKTISNLGRHLSQQTNVSQGHRNSYARCATDLGNWDIARGSRQFSEL